MLAFMTIWNTDDVLKWNIVIIMGMVLKGGFTAVWFSVTIIFCHLLNMYARAFSVLWLLDHQSKQRMNWLSDTTYFQRGSARECETDLANNIRAIASTSPASRLYNLVSGYICAFLSGRYLCSTCTYNICQSAPGRTIHWCNPLYPLGNHWRSCRGAIRGGQRAVDPATR